MNSMRHRRYPAAHGIGGGKLDQGGAHIDADKVRGAQHEQRQQRDGKDVENPKVMTARPKIPTAANILVPTPA